MVKTKIFSKAMTAIICIALLFAVVPSDSYAAENVETVEIKGVGKVHYIKDAQGHADPGEWQHVDGTIPGGGTDEFRMMKNGKNYAYLVENYPELPDGNGVEADSGGIPEKLFGTASMSFLEYWKGEDVENLVDTVSNEQDDEGYYDLGGFDTITRGTTKFGPSRTSYSFNNVFNGVSEAGEEGTFAPKFKAKQYYSSASGTIGYESVGSPYLKVVYDENDPNHMSGAYFMADTNPNGDNAKKYIMSDYDINGMSAVPASVNGVTYIENMILEHDNVNIPEAFKNITVGGTLDNLADNRIQFISDNVATSPGLEDARGIRSESIPVTANTGLLKHLNDNGEYSKASAGKNAYHYGVKSNGGWDSVTSNFNTGYGDYYDGFMNLQFGNASGTDTYPKAASRNFPHPKYLNYVYNLLGAKYEYYGDIDKLGVSSPDSMKNLSSFEGKKVLNTYGSKYAADIWWRAVGNQRIEIGFNFDSIRFGGTGKNTTKDGIYNFENAKSKTGFYKVTLYSIGHENVEKLIYVPTQYKTPTVNLSSDMSKLTLKNLDDELKKQITSGKATVDLKSVDGRTINQVAELTNISSTGTYTLPSDISLNKELTYRIVITTDSTAADITTDFRIIEPSAVTLSKKSVTLSKGTSETLKATITPAAANINTDIKWASSSSKIATVDKNGKVTAKESGTANITATTENNKKATCKVTVKQPSIKLSPVSATIYTKGSRKRIKLKATVTSGSKTVKWTSSNSKIAAVTSKGEVVAKKTGKVIITATANGEKAIARITVKKPAIKLSKTKATIKKGGKITIKATATPKAKITFKTSNKKVAKVTSKGVVKGKKKGKATITVKANGVIKKFKIKVK